MNINPFVLAAIVAAGSGRQVDGAVELDESLLGLRALALRCAGRVNTVAAGQARFDPRAS